MGGWGFWHMNNSREDIFEQVRLLLYVSESRFIMSQSEILLKRGPKPHPLAQPTPHGIQETNAQPGATQAKSPGELTERVSDKVTGRPFDKFSPRAGQGASVSVKP